MNKRGTDAANRLGQYLSNVRAAKELTLREVEEATGSQVSNAYLSQLEHGRITRPSPHMLHSLAAVYGVAYEILMVKAGYIDAPSSRQSGQKLGRAATFAIDNLTPDEEDALLDYLAYLRFRKGKRKKT